MKQPKWRMYRPGDEDQVLGLHLDQEQKLGLDLDFPDLLKKPVLLTLVAEVDGKVAGGFYIEAVPELCFFGTDPLVTASALRLRGPVLDGFLKKRGFRIVRTEVPESNDVIAARIGRELTRNNFQQTDEGYSHFMYDLRDGGRNGSHRNPRE
jgi:hypothetical protein